jgi:transcriptional regulator with GAF, ATPase, and Fis domain
MKPASLSGDVHRDGQDFLTLTRLAFPERSKSSQHTSEYPAFFPFLTDVDPRMNLDDLILNIREEAARLLPCDNVCLAFHADGFLQIFDKSHGRQSAVIPIGSRTSIWTTPEARLIPEDVADPLRCVGGIQAPFRINGIPAGTVSFLMNAPHAFQESDMVLAQRIADSIGVFLARDLSTGQGSVLAPCISHDWDNLVRAVCEVPDIHRILPKISSFLQPIITHDRLTISFHDKDRNMWMRSVSNEDGPTFKRVTLSIADFPRDGSSVIINDLLSHRPSMQPTEFHPKAIDAGYRSFLVTHVWTGLHGLGFVFWSKRGNAFHRRDVPNAQRIAELCAVAVSREKLIPSLGETLPQGSASSGSRPSEAARAQQRAGQSRERSAAWNRVMRSAKQVASADTTVLLVGETGTGKEVVARSIHSQSSRKDGPFVAVNCAALPDSLLESELFGFERGAFTGAYHKKRGYVDMACGGVIFFDELSEMSWGAQAKLLRVLETREFQPLGSTRSQRADIRVIAATNKDLKNEVRIGKFRGDLYYRLCVFEISIPPLRSRKDDILPLAYQFLSEASGGNGKILEISHAAQNELWGYHWPGNVRELRNVVERASILSDGDVIDVEHLSFQAGIDEHPEMNEISVIERQMIERALRESGGNKARAARMLGLSRTQLYVRLRRYA